MREISDSALEAWSSTVSQVFDQFAAEFSRFYNPTVMDTPDDHQRQDVDWPAFPGTLRGQQLSDPQRWEAADSSRDLQDEYCEWSVLRNGDGKVERITFTSETFAYYDHLISDPATHEVLLDLYGEATGQVVSIADLQDEFGQYKPDNQFNDSTTKPIVHLTQDSNTLFAAVALAAQATILREENGVRIVHPQALVRCGRLGVDTRHSDPRIAAAVNDLVANGFDITLGNPPGLYLDRLETTGMQTPDGTDAAEFWQIERGEPGHVVRARFEVPKDLGYTVGDMTIGGRTIDSGGQLADRVHVRVSVVAKSSTQEADTQPCKKDPSDP